MYAGGAGTLLMRVTAGLWKILPLNVQKTSECSQFGNLEKTLMKDEL